jgi:PelA/Pel-15E family pectate lyase
MQCTEEKLDCPSGYPTHVVPIPESIPNSNHGGPNGLGTKRKRIFNLREGACFSILVAACSVATHCFAQDASTGRLGPALRYASKASESLAVDVRDAIRKASQAFRTKVGVQGGYVYQVSEDGRYREGEGNAYDDIVWVQPPGTPAVGIAYLEAYRATGDQELLDAAMEVVECLRVGQLHSGGWQNHILLSKEDRSKFAYRVDGPRKKKSKNWSSLDDDQTQSVIRFLALLDYTLEGKQPQVHELLQTALDGLLANQFPNGAWAQGFESLDAAEVHPVVPARYPEEWPRKHPGEDYWVYYTLNDNALVRVLETLWMVYDLTGKDEYRDAALRGADFLLLAQMPDPQPAWAQQYNFQMEPVWARKFEPAAISGGESQSAIDHLLDVYERSGDQRYLKAAQKGWSFLSSLEDNEELARFYELKTNRPLYFTSDYELTYDANDLPTHYAFRVPSRLPALGRRINKLQDGKKVVMRREWKDNFPKPSQEEVRRIIDSMNSGGLWVENGKLKYVKASDHNGRVIRSDTFIRNLRLLSGTAANFKATR